MFVRRSAETKKIANSRKKNRIRIAFIRSRLVAVGQIHTMPAELTENESTIVVVKPTSSIWPATQLTSRPELWRRWNQLTILHGSISLISCFVSCFFVNHFMDKGEHLELRRRKRATKRLQACCVSEKKTVSCGSVASRDTLRVLPKSKCIDMSCSCFTTLTGSLEHTWLLTSIQKKLW